MTVQRDRLNNLNNHKKRNWLTRIVERIGIRYLHELKEHELTIGLKIPLFSDEKMGIKIGKSEGAINFCPRTFHSTVTDFARLRGWSTSVPFRHAVW